MTSEIAGYITMSSILDAVPVTTRTVRNWIHDGLLPRPLKLSEGYRCGVVGYYPIDVLRAAKIAYVTSGLPLEKRRAIIQGSPKKEWYVDDDGTLIVRIKIKEAT